MRPRPWLRRSGPLKKKQPVLTKYPQRGPGKQKEMASVIILNSKKRNKFERSEIEIEAKALTSLPQEPWEADLTLCVLNGGR
jgi:hypothetical protein